MCFGPGDEQTNSSDVVSFHEFHAEKHHMIIVRKSLLGSKCPTGSSDDEDEADDIARAFPHAARGCVWRADL